VQLKSDAAAADRIVGRVESLDSGHVAGFDSARGLLRFLRGALIEPALPPPSGDSKAEGES
jgi:hypothetical protein